MMITSRTNILLLATAGRLHQAIAVTSSLRQRQHQQQRTVLGGNYCTFSPDETCYQTGWPSCCTTSDECPDTQPACEIRTINDVTTTPTIDAVTITTLPEYCGYDEDIGCYAAGVPSCCSMTNPEGVMWCPEEQPECDVTSTTTTTPATDAGPAPTTEIPLMIDPTPFIDHSEPVPDSLDPSNMMGPPYCSSLPNQQCYSFGMPECCREDPASCPEMAPACDTTGTTSTIYNPIELPVSAFPILTPPAGGLRKCNQVIPMNYPDNIIPKEVILAMLEGLVDAFDVGDLAPVLKMQLAGLASYDVRAHKVCTTCEDANALWEEKNACVEADGGPPCTSKAFASEVMPYCVEGSFASGRTMSGLLLEPIDSETKQPVVGKVAATIYNYATDPNPFVTPSEEWPSDPAADMPVAMGALAASTAGTYAIIPDVLGNGEDWESTRSYIVKALYQASAIPLLLKTKDDLEKNYGGCTELDRRVAILGYSEGGYAAVAVADAVDMLDDGYVHTFTGVGGAPLRLSSEQTRAIVEMYEGTFVMPTFAARLANSYSSTNGDLVNTNLPDTDIQQNFASEKFMDPYDQTKNAIEWAKAGLRHEEMHALMVPTSPDERLSDVMNQDFVEMVINSFNANNTDPCNSEFKTDTVDKLCEAFIENDVHDIIQNIDYPVTICHSPNDDLIYYSNIPDMTINDNLMLLEDTPLVGALLKPTGNHYETYGQCLMGFIVPYIAPAETSNVRSILPVGDPDGICYDSATTASTASVNPPSSDGIAGTSPTKTASLDGETNTSPTNATFNKGDVPEVTPAGPSGSGTVPTQSPTPSPSAEGTEESAASTLSVAASFFAMYLTTIFFNGLW